MCSRIKFHDSHMPFLLLRDVELHFAHCSNCCCSSKNYCCLLFPLHILVCTVSVRFSLDSILQQYRRCRCSPAAVLFFGCKINSSTKIKLNNFAFFSLCCVSFLLSCGFCGRFFAIATFYAFAVVCRVVCCVYLQHFILSREEKKEEEFCGIE